MTKPTETNAKKKPAARKTAKASTEAAAAPVAPARKAVQKTVQKKAAPKKVAAAAPEPAPAEKKPPVRSNSALDSPLAAAAGLTPVNERSGKYVYCIIPTTEDLRFGPIGIGGEPADVHTVNYLDIAAVVSDTPLEVYDPTRENVLAHERVNEVVMRNFTVIPMSFSTVFKTSEDIVELLRTAYDAFRDVLIKMKDKLEFGLKVLWEPEIIIREIEKDDENLRLLRQQISHQKGSTYFARMQYGRLVDSLLQERSEQLVAEIFSTLGDVSVASRANKPIGDKMILNAAFLVSRDREPDFDAKVKEIDARYENLMFKYTGPWPPYNFVNIRLKLERATE
ncbi:MAG TPA: GvpL/GvpF family gas vesicle protein [Thermoanaerobaculia bacterium]|nr:GvpL/GvpF family gas vesicle protein [Thermoanaerobaculia bacterium]